MDIGNVNLFKTSAFLDTILNCEDFSIIVTDYSGVIRYFSKGAEKMLGYEAEEVEGIHTPELFHSPDEVKTQAVELSAEFDSKVNPGFNVFTKKAELGLDDDKIWTYIRKDKKKLKVKLSITQFTDPETKFSGIIGIAKDISDDINTQEELIHIKKLNRTVIENADVWITTLDTSNNIIIWNRAAERISGYKKEEAIFDPDIWEKIYPIKKYREEVFGKAAEMLKTNEFVEGYETKIKHKDGKYRIISWSFRYLLDSNNEEYGTIVIGNDITSLKKAEFEQQENKKLIEEKNKELENIVYVTSHDLRSPLVNIQGFTKEIQSLIGEIKELVLDENVDEQKKEKLEEIINKEIKEANDFIDSSVNKMSALLEGLLQLSRLGRSQMVPEKVDLEKVFDEIICINEYMIKEAEIEVKKEKLPKITADYNKVSQIFSNLFENAIKYRDLKKKSYIEISGRSNENYHIITISDNGIGIKDKHIDKIFEIFHQLDPDLSKGEGLGLTIVKRLLEKHKGNITVESEYGIGTSFHISFPVV